MTSIIIFHSESFTEEVIKPLQATLMEILNEEDSCVVSAAGDTDDNVFYLLHKLQKWYPSSLFNFHPSSLNIVSKLVAENKFDEYGMDLIAFDFQLACKKNCTAQRLRDKTLLKNADIIIYRESNDLKQNDFKKKFLIKPTAMFIAL
jgi:hypothetical protein